MNSAIKQAWMRHVKGQRLNFQNYALNLQIGRPWDSSTCQTKLNKQKSKKARVQFVIEIERWNAFRNWFGWNPLWKLVWGFSQKLSVENRPSVRFGQESKVYLHFRSIVQFNEQMFFFFQLCLQKKWIDALHVTLVWNVSNVFDYRMVSNSRQCHSQPLTASHDASAEQLKFQDSGKFLNALMLGKNRWVTRDLNQFFFSLKQCYGWEVVIDQSLRYTTLYTRELDWNKTYYQKYSVHRGYKCRVRISLTN